MGDESGSCREQQLVEVLSTDVLRSLGNKLVNAWAERAQAEWERAIKTREEQKGSRPSTVPTKGQGKGTSDAGEEGDHSGAKGKGKRKHDKADVPNAISSENCDTPVATVSLPTADEAIPIKFKFKSKVKGLKLLSHEPALVQEGKLVDITHEGSSAIWLSAESSMPSDESLTLVYRPMSDNECAHLRVHGTLPDSQPYQTIVQGDEGRIYAEKYLRGQKSVDSSPTTVVEFAAPKVLIDHLFSVQSKNEDGAISHGLGSKGGRGLPLFNASLQSGQTTFRIVLVKRFVVKAVGAFGANRRRS